MTVPTAIEIDAIAESYRYWLNFDAQSAPSAAAKKHLLDIETKARKLLASFEAADPRALMALTARGETLGREAAPNLALIPTVDVSAEPWRAVLTDILDILNTLSTAAHQARDDIPTWQTMMAQRFVASALRDLYVKHGLTFAATVDEYGATSSAVAALLDVARRAGDVGMTVDAARKWVERAIKEKA